EKLVILSASVVMVSWRRGSRPSCTTTTPCRKSSVSETAASRATIPTRPLSASRSRRLPGRDARFSRISSASISASPFSCAAGATMTSSLIGGTVHLEQDVLVGGKLAREHDGSVRKRLLGAGRKLGLRHADVAQPPRQSYLGIQMGNRAGRGEP